MSNNCPVTREPCGSTACDPFLGVCAHARQAQEADNDFPKRVLHADLPADEAERRVDESRVPPERTIPRYPDEVTEARMEDARKPETITRDDIELIDSTLRGGGGRLTDIKPALAILDRLRTRIAPKSAIEQLAERTRSPGRRALDAVKDTNPKDAIGVLKIAITFISLPVILEVALGMMEGAFKYGRHNYREAGVRASVYVDATFRHLAAFWEGEDYDPDIFENTDVKVSHITKAIASLTVLRDSMIRGNWVDDRPPAVEAGWIAKLSHDVKKLAAKYPNPVPPVTEIGLRAKQEASRGSPL